jgi:hypothetical protein
MSTDEKIAVMVVWPKASVEKPKITIFASG